MKKSISILILFSVTMLAVNAQSLLLSGKGNTLPSSQTAWIYKGVAADTVGLATTTFSYYVVPDKDSRLYLNAKVDLHRVKGTAARINVQLQRRLWDNVAWTTDSAKVYGGTVADSAINFTRNTTGLFDRQYRILLTVSGSTAQQTRVDSIQWKFTKLY
jgi:hypothetical protein